MTNFFYFLGDFFYAIFDFMDKLANLPNVLFIIIGFFGLFYWLKKQSKYNQEAENNGTIK